MEFCAVICEVIVKLPVQSRCAETSMGEGEGEVRVRSLSYQFKLQPFFSAQ